MAIENGRLTNGIGRIVNGKFVQVPLKDATQPKPMNDKDRLARYRGERGEADRSKKEY